jgi:YVTN family beta-propeller protein
MQTVKKVRLAIWALVALTLVVMAGSTYAIDTSRVSAGRAIGDLFYLYASEPAETSVAVINQANYTKLASTNFSISFAHFVASSDGKSLYATAFGDLSLYLFLISLSELQVVATIPVGEGAHHLTLSDDGKTLYTAAAGAGVIAVIDTKSNSLQTKLSVGGAPQDVAVSSKYDLILVANSALDSVQAIDARTGSLVTSAPGLGKPVKLSLSSDQSYLAVTGENSSRLTILGLPNLKVQTSIPLGAAAHQLYLDSEHEIAYVGLQNNSLSVVSLRSDRVLKNIPLNGEVMDVFPDESLTRIFVSAGTHITTVKTADFSVADDLDLSTVVHGLVLLPLSRISVTPRNPGLLGSSTGKKSASDFTCGG